MGDYSEMALVKSMRYLAETQASIAHNLANINSTGFKRQVGLAMPQRTNFDSLLDDAPTVNFVQGTDWTSGSINATGAKLNVALEGEGFLMVRDGSGKTFYTRNGTMLIDKQGMLSNGAGHQFVDRSGAPISFGSDPQLSPNEIIISPDGTIRAGDAVVGQLGVFEAPAADGLTNVGQSLYVDRAGARPVTNPRTRVLQGHLEQSNVQSLNELTQMIGIQRAFQASGKALGALGRLQSAFVNAVNR